MDTEITQKPDFAPIRPNERIEVMDALRGFALLGIFLMNIEFFSQPLQGFMAGIPADLTGLDRIASVGIYLIVQGKFWVLFSLLFGMGFAVMYERAQQSQRSFFGPYLRRTLMLFALGLLHIVFFWIGDILLMYSVAAVFMLIFFKVRGHALWILGGLAYLGLNALNLFFGWVFKYIPEVEQQVRNDFDRILDQIPAASEVYANGNFMEVTAQRWADFSGFLAGNLIGFTIMAGGVFLIGMWFIRSGLMANAKQRLPFFKKLLLISLPIGAFFLWLSTEFGMSFSKETTAGVQLMSMGAFGFGNLFLSLSYLSLFVLAFYTTRGSAILGFLAPAGRMALTNYLSQSVLCSFLFYGYGLAWFGTVSRSEQVLLVLVVFAAQILFSRWWMARFNYGPLEWLWRAFTYLKLPAFRR